MKLTFRFLLMIVYALFRKRNCTTADESILRFTVMPWDCVVRFVGNDRYHAFMDLGRIDLILRIGWGKIIWKNKWEPFVRTTDIQYRQPLRMFHRFTLRTRIVYWDDFHFWMEHSFERRSQLVTIALSKNVAKGKNGLVSTREALRLLNRKARKPTPQENVRFVNEQEKLLKDLRGKRAQANNLNY